MAEGYGFGGEGDWKTSALVRAMKVMGIGLKGGNSFMEDYTYHFEPNNEMVLGSHMLEICPSIAMENHPAKFIHWVLAEKQILYDWSLMLWWRGIKCIHR